MARMHYYTCYCPTGECYHGEQMQTYMSDLPLHEKKGLWEEQHMNLYWSEWDWKVCPYE